MPITHFRTTATSARRRAARPLVEGLEARTALSGSSVSIGFDAAALTSQAVHEQVHSNWRRPVLGTISGTVINAASGRGIARIKVQLINSQGAIAAVTTTNARGRYAFRINANGPYVVREVTPRRLKQTAPTFDFSAPTGSFANNPAMGQPYGSGSWSYDTGNSDPANGAVGPYAWDTVAPAGNLPFQSPINIVTPAIDLSPYLQIHYANSTPTRIVNNGHQIQVQYPVGNPADSISVDGTDFDLAQFHFHDPSETTVNGHGFPMEMHFVNTSEHGAETVVAVFLQLGAYNPSLQPILDAATSALSTPNTETPGTTPINFSGLLPSNMMGWFYEGSLTTPPLSQTVNWFVFATPITLDSAQLQQYEAVARASGFLPNNRAVQPLDGRQVNQFNFDVNFDNQSVSALTFELARLNRAASGSVARPASRSDPA